MKQNYDKNELKKMQRASLAKLAAVAVFIVVVVIFNSLSWFTMSREVEGAGVQMTASGLPFEIATSGLLIRNQSALQGVRSEYTDGKQGTLLDKNNVSGTYYTSDDTDSLILRFDPVQADDSSTTDIDERYLPDIGPGSEGELNLYIIPKYSGNLDAYFQIDIIGYTFDDSSNLVEINDDLSTSSGLSAEKIAACKKGANYLNGHIMFFEEKSNVQTYLYKKPLVSNVIHFSEPNAVGGRAYKVPVYWTWSNTLGQIALKTNTNQLREGTPIVEETDDAGTEQNPTDKAIVLSYLKNNKDSFFKDLDIESVMTDAEKVAYENYSEEEKANFVDNKINDCIDSADTEENFNLLSEGYNAADFMIGTNLEYFMIEINVTSGN